MEAALGAVAAIPLPPGHATSISSLGAWLQEHRSTQGMEAVSGCCPARAKLRYRLSTYQGLDEDLQRIEMDEEDDKAMGKEISSEEAAATSTIKVKLNWRALRHASHTQLRHFAALGEKRDIHILTTAIKLEEEARVPAVQTDAMAMEADGNTHLA